ncbi:MAG: Ig-like domain repeat protein [Cyanobacteria bacterium P01_E01_bin.42]
MPVQPDSGHLGTDPHLLDRSVNLIPPSDLDRPLNHSPSASSNNPIPPSPNERPMWGFNLLQQPRYTARETLTLEGWIEDVDGVSDLDRIDLTLDLNGRPLNLGQITQFVSDPHNPNRATFSHDIVLKNLAIGQGFSSGNIHGVAYDRSGRGTLSHTSFEVTNHSPTVRYYLRESEYDAGDTLTIEFADVEDRDGIEDVSHVHFQLRRQSGGNSIVIDLPNVTEFYPDYSGSSHGTFDYSIDLSTVALPEGHDRWDLESYVVDKAGNSSPLDGHSIFIRNHAPNLHFDFVQYSRYSVGDILTFDYASVEDFDGIDTLDRIDFKLILENSNSYYPEQEIDLPDVTEFIPIHNGATLGSFNYNLDLSTLNLPIGSHSVRLEGTLYDKAGNSSMPVARHLILDHEQPFVNFTLDRVDYSANEVLFLSNTGASGISNIERIDFRVRDSNFVYSSYIDAGSVTEFTPNSFNPSHGFFTYDLDLKTLDMRPNSGSELFFLESIIKTKTGKFYTGPEVNFTVSHFLPNAPIFSLDRQSYTENDILTLVDARVFDSDRATDIARIDFHIYSDNGLYIDLPDVTALNIANPDRDRDASFEYSFDLSTLPIDLGTHTLYLEAIAFDRLGNSSPTASQQFQFTKNSGVLSGNAPNLDFYLDGFDFVAGETIVLENAWVEDLDDISDIERVDFFLLKNTGHLIDLADVTELTVDPNNPHRGTFDYSFKLENLGLAPDESHNFRLIGIAYDKSGLNSQARGFDFSVSNGISLVNFWLDKRDYGFGETLTLQNSWVEDRDGLDDNIDRIDFQLFVENYYGNSNNNEQYAIDLPDVTEFTPSHSNSNRGTFNYSLDLWKLGLEPGQYNLLLTGGIYGKNGWQGGYSERFNLNTWSPNFDYEIDGLHNGSPDYDAGDTLTVTDGRILKLKNISDIDRIDFKAIVNDNIEIDMPDVTEFTLLEGGSQATFDYSYHLADLGLDVGSHRVQIEAILYDKAGNSNPYYRPYDIYVTSNSPPRFDFRIDSDDRHFAVGETIPIIDGWVEEELEHIDRIEFVAIVNGNNGSQIVNLPDVTQFMLDENSYYRNTFEYAVDLTLLGLDLNTTTNVILEARIIDTAGNIASPVSYYPQSFDVSNYAPNVDFQLDRSQYGFNDTLAIDGWFADSESMAEFERIDLRLRTENWGEYIDIADITSITPDPDQFNQGIFHHEISLASLGLPLGNYEFFLDAIAYDKAGNGSYSTQGFAKSFRLTNNIPQFNFTLPQGEYRPDDTIAIAQGWVEDPDSFNDVDRVEFSLRNLSNGNLIDVADVADFTADSGSLTRGSYTYSLYLGSFDLQPGNYDLEGIVFDKQGNSSLLLKREFAIAQPLHAPQDLRFSLDKSEYTARETIAIDNGWISDADGGADIARVNLRLFDAGDNFLADLGNVANLEVATWDLLWASFNAQIDLSGLNLTDGMYTISAIGYDITDRTSNVFERSFTIASPPPNFAPANLTFSLDRSTYTPADTINLGNGWVRDENGADTLDRIDLRILTEQGMTLDIEDITNLSPASWNREWASFQFGVNLQDLNLPGGSHKLIGLAYDAGGAASQQFERGFFLEVPQSNLAPSNLNFTLNQNIYNPTDVLTIGNGWISDGDGAEDIESVSFKLVDGNGSEIDLGAIADFSIASWSPEWASFSGSFDLSQYNLNDGNYTLIGMARDKSGGESQTLSRGFTIETPQTNNTAPTNLQFGLSGNTFSSGDTLEITNGWISDEDGNSDLTGVEFELVAEDGTVISLEDSFDLTAATWDWSNQWSSFRHSINFNVLGLTSGVYTIRGKAYDRAGNYSNSFSRSFTLV